MRILILGGTGFIGSRVVARLLQRGHEVCVFHRGNGSCPRAETTHIHGDLNRLPENGTALRALAPEVVVHMRAMSPADAQAYLEVFSEHTPRTVLVSSQDVYKIFAQHLGLETGEANHAPLAEGAALRVARFPYGGDYDKRIVEEMFTQAMPERTTILRLPAVYGPGDGQRRFWPWIRRMDDKRPYLLTDPSLGNWKWTHAHVENVAEAIALAAHDPRAAGQVFNVGEAQTPMFAERLHGLGQAAGYRGKVAVLPRDECPPHLFAEGDLRSDLIFDTMKIRRELGYVEIFSEKEGHKSTVEYLRANPPDNVDAGLFDYAAEDAALRRLGLLGIAGR